MSIQDIMAKRGIAGSFTSRAFCKAAAQTKSPVVEKYFLDEWGASLSEAQTTGTKGMANGLAKFLMDGGNGDLFDRICRSAGGEAPDTVPAPEPVPAPVKPVETPATPHPVPATPDKAAALEALMGLLGGGSSMSPEDIARIESSIEQSVRDKIMAEFGPGGGNPTRIEVIDRETGKPSGAKLAHSITELASMIASPDVNLALTGEAGGGKTYLGSMLAEARGLPFVPVSCNPVMTPGQLIGSKNIQGKFDEAILIQACRKPTFVLLDEFDNMRGDLAAVTNSLLANRTITIPITGEVLVAHEETVFAVAMNTYGTGATDLYQRQRMDSATMDRFMFLNMKYDPALTAAMSGCDVKVKSPDYNPKKGGLLESAEAWFWYIEAVQKAVCKAGIKHVVSPRATKTGIALAKRGVGVHWLKEGLVFKGLPAQHRKTIEEGTKDCLLVAK